MPKSAEPSPYTAYILRSWLEGSAWRYSLEEMGSAERHGFAGLDDFVAFMLAREAFSIGAETRPPRTEKSRNDANK